MGENRQSLRNEFSIAPNSHHFRDSNRVIDRTEKEHFKIEQKKQNNKEMWSNVIVADLGQLFHHFLLFPIRKIYWYYV